MHISTLVHSYCNHTHSAAGSDILLQTPPNSSVSLIEYRMLGGVFDFYFFSGPSDAEVIAQHGAIVGYPFMPPAWGFGFHLCRWVKISLVLLQFTHRHLTSSTVRM